MRRLWLILPAFAAGVLSAVLWDGGEPPPTFVRATSEPINSHDASAAEKLDGLRPQAAAIRSLLEAVRERVEKGELKGRKSSGSTALTPDVQEASEGGWDSMVARYSKLAPGPERDQLLLRLTVAAQGKIEASRDLWILDFFRQIANKPDATRKERMHSVIVAHPLGKKEIEGLLDYYEEHLGSGDSVRRAFAAEGLAWIVGPEERVARERLRGLVRDSDPRVRTLAIASLAVMVDESADADLFALQLERETDPKVARELIDAMKRVDPAGFDYRMRLAASRVVPELQPLVEEEIEAD